MNSRMVVIDVKQYKMHKDIVLDDPGYNSILSLKTNNDSSQEQNHLYFITGTGIIEEENKAVVFCGYGTGNCESKIQVARTNTTYIDLMYVENEKLLEAGQIAEYIYMLSKISLYAGERIVVASENLEEKSNVCELIEWMGGVAFKSLDEECSNMDCAIMLGQISSEMEDRILQSLKNNSIIVYNGNFTPSKLRGEFTAIRCSSTGAGFYDKEIAVNGKTVPEAYVPFTTSRNLKTAYDFIKSKSKTTDGEYTDHAQERQAKLPEYYDAIYRAFSHHLDSSVLDMTFSSSDKLNEEKIIKYLRAIIGTNEVTVEKKENSYVKVTGLVFKDGSIATLNELTKTPNVFSFKMSFDSTSLIGTKQDIKMFESSGTKTIWSGK